MKKNKQYKGTLGAMTKGQTKELLNRNASRKDMRWMAAAMGITQKNYREDFIEHIASQPAETRAKVTIGFGF